MKGRGLPFWGMEYAALVILFIFILIAVFAPLLVPFPPDRIDMQHVLVAPGAEYLLGTDPLGRDILSRLIIGTRISLGFAAATTFCTMGVGLVIGVVSGWCGGKIDALIQTVVNIFQGVPSFSLMIALAGILEPGFVSMLTAIVLTSWTGFSRVVRGEVIRLKGSPFMEGLQALGASPWFIIRHHVLRSLAPVISVLFTIRIGSVILSAAGLSYIGIGLQPPMADWGLMVNEGQTYWRTYPLLLYAPGGCIFLLCIAVNLLGESLKRRFMKPDWLGK